MPTYEIPVTISWPLSGSPGVNVWHIRSGATLTSTSTIDPALSALHDFYTAISPLCCADTFFTFPTEVAPLDGDREYESLPAFQVHGSQGAGNYAPPSVQVVFNMRGAAAGRSQQGRKFVGPLFAPSLGPNGQLTAPQQNVASTALTNLINASKGNGNGAIGIYSRKLLTFYDLATGSVPSKLGVLRSRRD